MRRPITLVILTAVCAGCGSADSGDASSIRVIGLRTETMNYHAASQRASNWCWAACVQMALSAHDVEVAQPEVVARAFDGWVVDQPGDEYAVLANLIEPLFDRHGRQRSLHVEVGSGPPDFADLRRQLEQQVPFIVGYEIPGLSIGHAVVITAVVYEETPSGPEVLRVLVRDPDPTLSHSRGKRELSRAEFDRIGVHYLITPLR